MIKKVIVCTIIAIVFSCNVSAQQYNHFLNSSYDYNLYKVLHSKKDFHSSIKPYSINYINQYVNFDSIQNEKKISFSNTKHLKRKNLLFNNNTVHVEEGDFTLIVNPSFNFTLGKDFSNSVSTYINSRGIQIMGSLGKNFSFYATIYENQARYPEYVNDFINKTGVVPGQGLMREYGDGGYDYSKSAGYLSYSPSKYFNIQFGTGKNFIGDGYRSLLLSDNSFNYPFLKLTATVWKLKYMSLFTEFMDFEMPHPENERFDKKYAAIHYLSWKVSNKFTLGLFEAVIFPAKYEDGSTRGFEFNYLNPLIFYRPVEFSMGSPDNAILGSNFSYLLGRNNLIYGQFILDEFRISDLLKGNGFWHNKFGYQLGIKCFDFFKVENLYVQFEYNRIRPYTYSHDERIQAYGHYNQPLAHPFGANFWEFITIANYYKKRFYFNYKFIIAKYGEDKEGKNYGKDIFSSYNNFVSEFDNYVGQGLTTTLLYNNIECSYLINPSYNLNFVLGFTNRVTKSDFGKNTTNYIYIGLRTSIDNFYFDL